MVTINVHHEEDDETGEERWTVSDDGEEFDDIVVEDAVAVGTEVEDRETTYQTQHGQATQVTNS